MKAQSDNNLTKNPSKETASVGDDEKASQTSSSFQDDQEQEGSSSLRFSTREEQEIAAALAAQAFHLPGNTGYWQDLRQYLGNNHPVLSFCFHHKLHPATVGARLLCLLTSTVFGLVLTNIVWLYANAGEDRRNLSFTVDVGDTVGQGVNPNATASAAYTQYLLAVDEANQVEITGDMVFLWTVGGAIHGWFDNVIWSTALCTCCLFGERLPRLQKLGAGLVTFVLLVITAVATLTVVLRVAMEQDEDAAAQAEDWQEVQSAGLWDDAVDIVTLTRSTNGAAYKEYLIACAAELWFALWLYYPLVAWLLFSGVLNFGGKFPCVGGRPQELKEREEEQEDKEEGQEVASNEDDNLEKGTNADRSANTTTDKTFSKNKDRLARTDATSSAVPDATTLGTF